MVVDRNARLIVIECALERLSLLRTPVAAGGFAVEHERVLFAPDGDVEKDVVPAHNVDAGVVVSGWGWAKVKGGGPEDDNSARLELLLGLYRLADVKEVQTHF